MQRFLIIPFFFIFLSACAANSAPKMTGETTRGIQTDRSINVLNATFNGEAVSVNFGQTCCVRIPQKWPPGLTAEIKWTIDPYPKGHPDDGKEPKSFINGVSNPDWDVWYQKHRLRETSHVKVISLPKYEKTCELIMVFLPCNDVTAVIDCKLGDEIIKDIYTGKGWEKVVVRRLGGKSTCPK